MLEGHRLRVESVASIEAADGEVRISANDGKDTVVFPVEVWEEILEAATVTPGPSPEELTKLEEIRAGLQEHAEKRKFTTILEDVSCGKSEDNMRFDLVLRPSGLFAVTTGYMFKPVVETEDMEKLGEAMKEESFVEQAYAIGAAADPLAIAAGDESVRALAVRGRRCSASRFELAPELWQVLSEAIGWRDVKPFMPVAEEKDV